MNRPQKLSAEIGKPPLIRLPLARLEPGSRQMPGGAGKETGIFYFSRHNSLKSRDSDEAKLKQFHLDGLDFA